MESDIKEGEEKEGEKENETKENKDSKIEDKNKEENEKDKNQINDKEKQTGKNEKENEKIDPHLIFQQELLNIIKKQEKILTATSTINEKFDVSNSITKEQIASFKTNIDKYGKYLLLIKKELGMISDTMRKIKKLAKEQKK